MALASYTIRRSLQVSTERVFRAFTDPADLAAWFWGADASDTRAHVDLRVGGSVEVSAASSRSTSSSRLGCRGVFLEVVPGRRVVQTLHWDADVGYNAPGNDPVDEALVVDIVPSATGCDVSYTHLGIPDAASAAVHEKSVRATLGDLERHLARADRPRAAAR